jgi:hypothetical protein
MTHQISIMNGKASMAYVGAAPWHGLGQNLTPGQPIEVWLREAGMDYTVLKSAVCYSADEDNWRVFDDRFVLFRSDNQARSSRSTRTKRRSRKNDRLRPSPAEPGGG